MKLHPGCWWREHHPITQSDLRAAPASNTLYRYPPLLNYLQHESETIFLAFFFSSCKVELDKYLHKDVSSSLILFSIHSFNHQIFTPHLLSTIHCQVQKTKHISHDHYNTKLWFLIITVLPPRWISGKESTHQSRRRRFNPCVGKIPWRRKQLTPVLLPGKSHGQRGLASYSPRSCRRVRVTQQLNTL